MSLYCCIRFLYIIILGLLLPIFELSTASEKGSIVGRTTQTCYSYNLTGFRIRKISVKCFLRACTHQCNLKAINIFHCEFGNQISDNGSFYHYLHFWKPDRFKANSNTICKIRGFLHNYGLWELVWVIWRVRFKLYV